MGDGGERRGAREGDGEGEGEGEGEGGAGRGGGEQRPMETSYLRPWA